MWVSDWMNDGNLLTNLYIEQDQTKIFVYRNLYLVRKRIYIQRLMMNFPTHACH